LKKSLISKQIAFWKAYGIYSPLVFVVGLIVCWWLEWFHIDTWFVIGGTILACTAVIWWWWTMFTINKLNNTLTKNVEQFLELLGIVKELNHDVRESSSNRQRGKPKANKNKPPKE